MADTDLTFCVLDLDQGCIDREPLPDEAILRKYIGGTGLGLYYLLQETPPQAQATDPEVPLIFMLGSLTGTPAVNSADWTTVCLNLSIPYAAWVGHSHGYWGAYLKHAGPSKGLSIAPYLPAMVDEYYRQMGWNVETGLPTPDTLRRLGMDEFLEAGE